MIVLTAPLFLTISHLCSSTVSVGGLGLVLHKPSKIHIRKNVNLLMGKMGSYCQLKCGGVEASIPSTVAPEFGLLKVQTLFPPDNNSSGMSGIRMYWKMNQILKKSTDIKMYLIHCYTIVSS